nr:helix-turn-helix domain-containing protein [Kineosporia babensis]
MHLTDSAAVVEILRAEERGAPLTPARLGERIGLTSGATSILLNRLESAGHITRERGHADRRLVTLRSAPAVHTDANAFFSPLAEQLNAILQNCTAEQLDLLEDVLEQFRDATETYVREEDPQ